MKSADVLFVSFCVLILFNFIWRVNSYLNWLELSQFEVASQFGPLSEKRSSDSSVLNHFSQKFLKSSKLIKPKTVRKGQKFAKCTVRGFFSCPLRRLPNRIKLGRLPPSWTSCDKINFIFSITYQKFQ